MTKNRAIRTIGLLCAGAGMGAATALLYAPHSGRRTRKHIRRFAKARMDRLHDMQYDMGAYVNNRFKELNKSVNACVQDATDKVDASRLAVVDALNGTKKYVDRNVDRLIGRMRAVAS